MNFDIYVYIQKSGFENQNRTMVIVKCVSLCLFLDTLRMGPSFPPFCSGFFRGLKYVITGSSKISHAEKELFKQLQIKQKDIDRFISFFNEQEKIPSIQ